MTLKPLVRDLVAKMSPDKLQQRRFSAAVTTHNCHAIAALQPRADEGKQVWQTRRRGDAEVGYFQQAVGPKRVPAQG